MNVQPIVETKELSKIDNESDWLTMSRDALIEEYIKPLTLDEYAILLMKGILNDADAWSRLEDLPKNYSLCDYKEHMDSVAVFLNFAEVVESSGGNVKTVCGEHIDHLWMLWKKTTNAEPVNIPRNTIGITPYAPYPLEYAYFNNTKVAHKLTEIVAISDNDEIVSINTKENQQTIFVNVSIKYDERVKIDRELDAFDKHVMDAVCGIYEASISEDNPAFTLQQVYRQMNGTDVDVNSESLKRIKQSIEKMIPARITIDARQQINARSKYSIEKAEYESYLLPLNTIRIMMSNGSIIEGYRFIEIPAIYEYARNIEQIIKVPIKLLDTRGKVNNTVDVVIIRAKLIERISSMKNPRARAMNNDKILYKWIFEKAEIKTDELTRTQLNRLRNKVRKILDKFVEEEFITAYTETKKGRAIDGIVIDWKGKKGRP